MPGYTSRDGAIVEEFEVPETGSRITFRARDACRERTGIHAVVAIMHGDVLLAWSRLNVEKDEERTRLANRAYSYLPALDTKAWPKAHMQHAFDLFCAGLWRQHVSGHVGEVMGGDPDIGPPKQLCGPFVIQGGGTILFAPPGRGKSYTALVMAVCLDAGCDKVWPVAEPKRTMYINIERSRDSMRYRLARVNAALGLDPQRPLTFMNARGRSLADIVEGVAATIREHEIEVLVVDSISRAGLGDLKEGATAMSIVDTLNALCPTWLALAHTPRSDESHIFGSMQFDAGEDVGVRLTAQAGESVTGIGLEVGKANDLPPVPLAVFALVWGPGGLEDIRSARTHEFPEIEAGRRLSLAQEMEEYLKLVSVADASSTAAAINRPRQNVSSTFSNDPRFVRVRQEGRTVLYGLRVPREYDTSRDTSGKSQI